jgi:hypothetical protein
MEEIMMMYGYKDLRKNMSLLTLLQRLQIQGARLFKSRQAPSLQAARRHLEE